MGSVQGGPRGQKMVKRKVLLRRVGCFQWDTLWFVSKSSKMVVVRFQIETVVASLGFEQQDDHGRP
jgi:hypothetical protein